MNSGDLQRASFIKETWARVKGLRSAWFWYDEKNQKTGYVATFCKSQAFTEALESGFFGKMANETDFLQETGVGINVYENLAGSEATTEMRNWPESKGLTAPTKNDLKGAVILVLKFSINLDFESRGFRDQLTLDDIRSQVSDGGLAAAWTKVPGLITKQFVLLKSAEPQKNSQRPQGGAFLVFATAEDCRKCIETDKNWAAIALTPHFEDLRFDVYPLLEGSAFTCRLGSWPEGNQVGVGEEDGREKFE